MLSVALVLVAVYNAYLLFHRRRTYRLWHRDERVCRRLTQDVLRNPHATLEEPPRDPPPPRSWQAWAADVALVCARQVPVLEWFVPPAPVRVPPPPSERVYTLRVWDVLEAPLWVFAYVCDSRSLYSPAHALYWAVAGSLGLGAWTTWALTAVLMAAFSLQTYYLAEQYAALVRDRQVLSSEVLREYDEKVRALLTQFVFPRAMPLVRDASTMTEVAAADIEGY